MRLLSAAATAALLASPVLAHNHGFAGLMANTKRETLEPLTLASGKPVAAAPYKLKSDTYYKMNIEVDGGAELALSARKFFRSVWINKIVINDIEENRPMDVHTLQFDAVNTVEMSFVAMTPGSYKLRIPGTVSDTQSLYSTFAERFRPMKNPMAAAFAPARTLPVLQKCKE